MLEKMILMKKRVLLLCFSVLIAMSAFAQDDLLSMLDSSSSKKAPGTKVIATFKNSKIVNAQTTETVKAKTMDFKITHRFGNMGTESNGGVHTLYGWDNIQDVRLSFDFGITDKLTLGVGRSKRGENLDGSLKYRLLEQTTDNKVPLSMAIYEDLIFTPQTAAQLYAGTVNPPNNNADRFTYVSQLIIARKFGPKFSFEVLPTYVHRNYVMAAINPDNGASETNDLFALGGGGRIKLGKRVAIIADYFYTFSDYRMNNSSTPFYNVFAVGIEIETGGHVFHIDLTNAPGILEGDFLANTTDSWLKGGFKLGFNISRVFNL